MLMTFVVTVIAWIFFRAPSISDANSYIFNLFSGIYEYNEKTLQYAFSNIWIFILVLLVVEWIHREKQHGLQFSKIQVPMGVRWGSYSLIILIISFFGAAQQEFIYFQF